MSWPTELPSTEPTSTTRGSDEHPQSAALLARIGTCGWSALVSYGEPIRFKTQLGAWSVPGSCLADLGNRGLISFRQLPAGAARTISVLHLTREGRRRLSEVGLNPIQTEYELLRDRWGMRAEEHHGQVILFAALSRGFGYRTEVGVAVPGQRLFADVRLTKDDGTEAWCLVESGSRRDSHPLDRWHRLGRCQPFLPLVAPDRETMNRLGEQARPHIYRVYLTNLDDLVLNAGDANRRLWLADVNRFRDAGRGHNRGYPD